MSERIEKINDLIRDHISEILLREISLKKGVFVSVIKVSTTKDLEHAKLMISVFPQEERQYVKATLRKEMFRIQGALNRKMSIRIVPRIEFQIDTTQENVDKIESLFKQIKEEEQE